MYSSIAYLLAAAAIPFAIAAPLEPIVDVSAGLTVRDGAAAATTAVEVASQATSIFGRAEITVAPKVERGWQSVESSALSLASSDASTYEASHNDKRAAITAAPVPVNRRDWESDATSDVNQGISDASSGISVGLSYASSATSLAGSDASTYTNNPAQDSTGLSYASSATSLAGSDASTFESAFGTPTPTSGSHPTTTNGSVVPVNNAASSTASATSTSSTGAANSLNSQNGAMGAVAVLAGLAALGF